jgi:hypothetical protein
MAAQLYAEPRREPTLEPHLVSLAMARDEQMVRPTWRRLGVVGSRILTSESTSSAYIDLATVGPTVTVDVGPSGRAIVILGSYMANSSTGVGTFMTYEVSGASTISGSDNESAVYQAALANFGVQLSHVVLSRS